MKHLGIRQICSGFVIFRSFAFFNISGCRSSSFHFFYVDVSTPCHLTEYFPNRASIIQRFVFSLILYKYNLNKSSSYITIYVLIAYAHKAHRHYGLLANHCPCYKQALYIRINKITENFTCQVASTEISFKMFLKDNFPKKFLFQ